MAEDEEWMILEAQQLAIELDDANRLEAARAERRETPGAGPGTAHTVARSVARLAAGPEDHHRWWRSTGQPSASDGGVAEHDQLWPYLEVAGSKDQLDLSDAVMAGRGDSGDTEEEPSAGTLPTGASSGSGTASGLASEARGRAAASGARATSASLPWTVAPPPPAPKASGVASEARGRGSAARARAASTTLPWAAVPPPPTPAQQAAQLSSRPSAGSSAAAERGRRFGKNHLYPQAVEEMLERQAKAAREGRGSAVTGSSASGTAVITSGETGTFEGLAPGNPTVCSAPALIEHVSKELKKEAQTQEHSRSVREEKALLRPPPGEGSGGDGGGAKR